jgi:phosphatidylinositol alpha-1,6-mannosyltransferase
LLVRSTSLLVTENFPPRTGGSSRWFWELYRRLPAADFMVAAAEARGQSDIDAQAAVHTVRLPLELPGWGLTPWSSLPARATLLRELRRIVSANDIGMIHCGRPLPEGVLGWALRLTSGVPYVCYVHGEEMNTARSSRELTLLARRVLADCEAVISNSENTRSILRGEWRVPAHKNLLLHPGVDAGYYVPAPRDAEIRRALGWSERPVVLTVGRLQRRKGQDQLIRAVAQVVRRSVPDVLYAIVGEGAERERLASLIGEQGLQDSVVLMGELDDRQLLHCYQQCDLFALPNREIDGDIEGFGMVLLEAQACGKPVIAGASGGTSETMRVGESGLIVDCQDPIPLGELVAKLLQDPERLRRMGAAGRAWVASAFDWPALASEAQRLFEGLCDMPAAG